MTDEYKYKTADEYFERHLRDFVYMSHTDIFRLGFRIARLLKVDLEPTKVHEGLVYCPYCVFQYINPPTKWGGLSDEQWNIVRCEQCEKLFEIRVARFNHYISRIRGAS